MRGSPDLAIAQVFTNATGPQKMTACSGLPRASDGTFSADRPASSFRFSVHHPALPAKCYVEFQRKSSTAITCHNPHEKLENVSQVL